MNISTKSLRQHGKLQIDLEKVAIGGDLKLSPLQVNNALRDGKPKSVALRAAGAIGAHEALHKLVGRNVQFRSGDIFERDDAHIAISGGVQIDARAGQGIFADIAEQIIKYTPKKSAVCGNGDRIFGQTQNGDKLCGAEFFIVFACRLLQKNADIQFFKVDLDISRRCLGGFHKVCDELFEAGRLTVDDLDVSDGGFVLDILFFQKVGVIDDGGERGLDIVGNVCDQLRFHAFGFHTLVNGFGKSAADVVERFTEGLKFHQHIRRIDMMVKTALFDLLRALAKLAEAIRDIRQNGEEEKAFEKNEEARSVAEKKNEKNIEKKIECENNDGLPDQGDDTEKRFYFADKEGANDIDGCIFEKRFGLDANGKADTKRKHEQIRDENDKRHTHQEHDLGYGILNEVAKQDGKANKQNVGEAIDIERDLFDDTASRRFLIWALACGVKQIDPAAYRADEGDS